MDRTEIWDYIINYMEPGPIKVTKRRQLKRQFCRILDKDPSNVTEDNYKILCARWFALTHKQELKLESMDDYINCVDKFEYYKNMENKMSGCDVNPVYRRDGNFVTKSPDRPRTEEDDKRDYLLDRLMEIRNNRLTALRSKFNMDERTPTTVKELIHRIETGKYTLPLPEDIATKESHGYTPTSIIRWRDPNAPADPDGYHAALEKDDAAYQSAKDVVMVKTGNYALDAVVEYTNS